jgi:hypothetical protein
MKNSEWSNVMEWFGHCEKKQTDATSFNFHFDIPDLDGAMPTLFIIPDWPSFHVI